MWWEFGGGDVVAFVNIPTEDEMGKLHQASSK